MPSVSMETSCSITIVSTGATGPADRASDLLSALHLLCPEAGGGTEEGCPYKQTQRQTEGCDTDARPQAQTLVTTARSGLGWAQSSGEGTAWGSRHRVETAR